MIMLNGTQALNLDQVVDMKYTPEHEGDQDTEYFDQETGKMVSGSVHHHFASRLEITTAAVKFETQEYDYSQFHAVGGCASKVIVLMGEDADIVWKYIESRCEAPILEA